MLDEAQYIKNPRALTAISACKLSAAHRLCLSGTPMENHLGELWSLMRFLMPGFLADEKTFNTHIRKPIERDHSDDAQLALNRRVSPLILRRTKDQVATELPAKTTLIHGIDLTPEANRPLRIRARRHGRARPRRHRRQGPRQVPHHRARCPAQAPPDLLPPATPQNRGRTARAPSPPNSTISPEDLLPTLIEEGRRILLFSQFTSMLALIEEHLQLEKIPYLKLTGQTKDRANLVETIPNRRDSRSSSSRSKPAAPASI